MAKKIICIYDGPEYHRWVKTIIEGPTEYFEYEILHFNYPELFQKWIDENKPDFNDFALIILGSMFSGDGTPNVKVGNYRGLEFYAEERKKPNNIFYKTKTIIVAYASNDGLKLKEYDIKLKKQDRFIDFMNILDVLINFLESKQTIESQ